MASGQFGTQTAEMEQTAQKLDLAREEMRKTAQDLQQSVQALVGGPGFKGAAANAFNQVMVRWGDETNTLCKALQDISEGMSTSSKRYAAEDEAQQSNMSSIANALG